MAILALRLGKMPMPQVPPGAGAPSSQAPLPIPVAPPVPGRTGVVSCRGVPQRGLAILATPPGQDAQATSSTGRASDGTQAPLLIHLIFTPIFG